MKNFKSHFKFNKQERSGIFFLLLSIILLQVGYYVFQYATEHVSKDKIAIDEVTQAKIDALKEKALLKDTVKIFPFNPNFITDYKGYTLGMSAEEIDRLHAYRAKNKFTNSSEEFQKITLISDSLLAEISPYFKFPEWTKRQQKPVRKSNTTLTVKDINKATSEELKTINGIGDKLSVRIVKFRDRLGGFLVQEQLYDVYGLEAVVAERILKKFPLLSTPTIDKINLKTASVAELTKLVYIRYAVANEIVSYRERNGEIKSLNELTNIKDFPSDKIDRLALYLSL